MPENKWQITTSEFPLSWFLYAGSILNEDCSLSYTLLSFHTTSYILLCYYAAKFWCILYVCVCLCITVEEWMVWKWRGGVSFLSMCVNVETEIHPTDEICSTFSLFLSFSRSLSSVFLSVLLSVCNLTTLMCVRLGGKNFSSFQRPQTGEETFEEIRQTCLMVCGWVESTDPGYKSEMIFIL